MKLFMVEMIGTMLLVLLGDGAVAGVLLNKSRGVKQNRYFTTDAPL